MKSMLFKLVVVFTAILCVSTNSFAQFANKSLPLQDASTNFTVSDSPAQGNSPEATVQSQSISKDESAADYRPVPPTAAELLARNVDNPKKDGALVLQNLDRSTPVSADPNSPNFYYYHGQVIPMPLDATRLAVRVAPGVDLSDPAHRTPQKIGIAISNFEPIGADRWSLIELAQPVADEAEAHAVIQAVLAAGTVEYAAPVFRSLMVSEGWVTICPDVLVRFHSEQGAAALAELADGLPIKQVQFGGMDDAYRLGSPHRNGFEVLSAANRLASDARVKWAEPELFFTGRSDVIPDDSEMANLWGIRNTGATYNGTTGTDDIDMDGEEAWNITNGVSSVRVLVIDTGVQQNHPDINQNTGRDFTGGEADGVAGGGPVNACDNHGTAVAGCVSAHFNNALGVVGLAPSCRAVSARCMVAATPTCGPNWNASNTWTVNALNWAVNNGIQITNNSNNYGTVSTAIEDAYLNGYNSGQVHFASAGNSGASSIAYPGSVDTVNSVANITQTGVLNASSQFGTGLDFCAPGTDIRTTDRTGTAGYGNTDYTWINGTSFSSPYAASVAALVKVAHPTWSSSTIETAMKSGATDLGAFSYDTTFGWGLVNAYKSITVFGPSNDQCINPIVITGASYSSGNINTVSATTSSYYEPEESCEFNNNGVSNSVWFKYEPPAPGWFTVNTFGSNYDTVLSIWDGCNFYIGANIFYWHNEMGCSDDINGGLQSQVSNIPASPGSVYMIKVADYNTTIGGGTLNLNLSFTYGPPVHDLCNNRTPLPNTPGVYAMPAVYTGGATATAGDCHEMDGTTGAACGHPSGNSNSVFYSFLPTVTGTVTIDTFGSNYDTVLALYNGTAFANPCGDGGVGFCMGPDDFGYYICDDDAWPGNLQSRIWQYPVTAGHVFVLKVSDYNPTPAGGWLNLNINYSAPRGDVNGDGAVTVADLPFMLNMLLNAANCPGCVAGQADMNYDGQANGLDIQLFVNELLN